MVKKRKSEATRLDDFDRTMHSTFCSAANSLSQLYTQAMNQQKLAFQAGERHGLWPFLSCILKSSTTFFIFKEKLYNWILRQNEEGSRVTGADLVAYLQNELDYSGEDASMSPRLQFQHQHSQPTVHSMNPSVQVSSGSVGQATVGQGHQFWHSDQTKNPVFSNALSSPIRWSLQPFQLAQGGGCQNNVLPNGNPMSRNHEANLPHQNRDSNTDSSMDMHEESPRHGPY